MSIHVLPRTLRRRFRIICLVTLLVAASGTARADDRDTGASETVAVSTGQPPPQAGRDFLFGRPRAFLGASVGWLDASEAGGIFDFTRELLTVDDGAFDTAVVRFSVGLVVSPRLDIVAEVDVSRASVVSEFREVVDSDDFPIIQTTELEQTAVGGSLRFWLIPRGREVSRLAWLPNRIAPYVGAGGGARWYRFRQVGDFVDFTDFRIFFDQLGSSGWTASGHLFGGASLSLARRFFLEVEARYVWAGTPLSGSFVGFDNIDLSGFQTTGGIIFVF